MRRENQQKEGCKTTSSQYRHCKTCRYCSTHRKGAADSATCEFMYMMGQSRTSICDALGVSRKCGEGCPVHVPLRKDEPARRRSIVLPGSLGNRAPRKKLDREAALRLYNEGLSDGAIARRLGSNQKTVWAFRTSLNLPKNYTQNGHPTERSRVCQQHGSESPPS